MKPSLLLSYQKFMSLRGIKKQLYRTPHQIFGNKTSDDIHVKQWESDLTTAIAGLEYIKLQEQKWSKHWVSMISNFSDIIDTFKDLHSSLVEDPEIQRRKKSIVKNREKGIYDEDTLEAEHTREADPEEELSNITMFELNQASRLAKMLLREIAYKTDKNSNSFKSKCDDMITVLKSSEKLLTKRNHKKIDLEMQNRKVNSLIKAIGHDSKSSDKDKANLEIHNEKLSDYEIVFHDIDLKMKSIIPQVLESLEEFNSKLALKFYFSHRGYQNLIQRNLRKFVMSQGFTSSSLNEPTYEEIIKDFEVSNSLAMEKLESLILLKDFKEFREKNAKEKTIHSVNNVAESVVDTTVNITSTVYTKTTKPNQKVNVSLKGDFGLHNPVKPFDKMGVYSTACDPIEFLKQSLVVEKLATSPLDKSLHLSYFPSNPEENNEIVNVNNNDTNWMKPLRNSTIKAPAVTSNNASINMLDKELPSPPTSATTGRMSVSDANTSIAPPLASSAVGNKETDTYKVATVSMNKVRQQIADVIMNPNIDHCPITSHLDVDEGIKNYVSAHSSIITQLFLINNKSNV